MGYLEFCSNCGKKNSFGQIDGGNRYHCNNCSSIHYENPKPTATLVCPNEDKILLVKRATDPGKGEWGLPGGFIERGETAVEGALRELFEETQLHGVAASILGTCSHFNTIFGDILLIGMEIKINNWNKMIAGDDAQEAELFSLNNIPRLAFPCHEKILKLYQKKFEDNNFTK